jgi:outer membrane protein TolC
VADTQGVYYQGVAAGELLATARTGAEIAQATLDAVERRVQGGVATASEQSLAQGQALSANLGLLSAERGSSGARRELAALLSLDDDALDVVLTDALPDPMLIPHERELIVERCRSTRLDLRAAEALVRSAEAELARERRRALPSVELGASVERPEQGASVDFLAGLGATVELPILDRNQVQIRRAELRREQVGMEYEALQAEVGQLVRAAVDRAALAARAAQFVSAELLPQAEAAAELARTAYDLGDTTLLTVLESQRAVLQARRSRVEALLEAAQARVDLERAAGAALETLSSADAGADALPAKRR